MLYNNLTAKGGSALRAMYMMRINFEEIIENQEEEEQTDFYDVSKARKAVGGLFAEDSSRNESAKVAIDVLPADLSGEKTSQKVRTPKSRYVFTEDGLEENLKSKNKLEHFEIVHHDSKQKEVKRPSNKKPATQPKRKSSNTYASMDGAGVLSDSESALSSAIRGIAVVLALIFLAMLVFLVYRNNILSRQLETAVLQAERVPTLEQDLSQARIDLEIATENLAYAESRLEVATLVPPPAMNGAVSADEYYSEYYTYGTEETNATTYSAAETPAERTHVVVSGDNLSRIATQFFGNASYANIQRIREANNLTNDVINIGQTLVIPN